MADERHPSISDPLLPVIRPLTTPEEFSACVRIQEEIWGAEFSQKIPEVVFLIASKVGGIVSGAFLPDEGLCGFVFGLTGTEEGDLVHWSDLLAVLPHHRRRGIGIALKRHQRERLLAMGVSRVYWTFDPLEARNAKLNLNRLGAVAREYIPEMYGRTGSPLHAGIGTDRFIVTWELDSSRVKERMERCEVVPPGQGVSAGERDRGVNPSSVPSVEGGSMRWEALPFALEGKDGAGKPGRERLALEERELLVAIPPDIQHLKREDPELAGQWRSATRRVLGDYMGRGWEVREVIESSETPCYLMVRRWTGDDGS